MTMTQTDSRKHFLHYIFAADKQNNPMPEAQKQNLFFQLWRILKDRKGDNHGERETGETGDSGAER